jgi:hypothetical protein
MTAAELNRQIDGEHGSHSTNENGADELAAVWEEA